MFEPRGICVVLLDAFCIVLAALPFAILTPLHNPFKRGFFCSDDSIKYPVKEDTISYQLLGGIMIPFSLLVVSIRPDVIETILNFITFLYIYFYFFSQIVIGECLYLYHKPIKSQQTFRNSYGPYTYKALSTFVFGAAVSQSLTDIAKYSVGRLRPHFLAVCKPQWSNIDCQSGYIEDFVCTGDKGLVNESRVSFYSGHSSFSMYCMVFLALYLQARLRAEWARLLRPSVQFFLIAASVYVGLSRISDYMHHWSDVLTGLFQGAVVAMLVVFFVSDFFKKRVSLKSEEDISHTSLQETTTNGHHYGSTD
ncbi:phospholipid phosphatase 1 isoform X1 [Denticeps clupeoides]|uniref:phospholipid phosphatase 1 isoform X1 n=1 Tax=Denticeps clupeoides TaxID=299321 RepID=UPI0010A3A735|nr:phospholipid phosphatase 1-like isoform X1 [Denticeps clupeoides]